MDNLTSKHNESKLINLECSVAYHHFPRGSSGFDVHLKTIESYDGRHSGNYKESSIQKSIEYEDRFNLGVLQIFIDGELSRSIMMEKYKNWLLLSRLISHNHPKLPLLTAFGQSKIISIATENDCEGIFATVNERNRMYLNCIDTKKFRMFNDETLPLFKKHLDVIDIIKKFPEPVTFKYTRQFVLYVELGGKINNLITQFE
jgi:hypothetical protein